MDIITPGPNFIFFLLMIAGLLLGLIFLFRRVFKARK